MHPLETYLTELRNVRGTGAGTPEASYYPALSNLLNEVGKTLKPKIKCVMNLADRGAGFPDGGFFSARQMQLFGSVDMFDGAVPQHGVIEVKSTADDTWFTADTRQVSSYWDRYRQVLVTNLRDFLLVGEDADGQPLKLEPFKLADSEAAFWNLTCHPRLAVERLGERLVEYLKRVMLHSASLADPKDVAEYLASYARDARARVEHSELPALTALREGLEEALGLKFNGKRGDHFFRSTLVQTLFYGIFSAWVLWCKDRPQVTGKTVFDWRKATWTLRVPMIRSLFEQVATPERLGPLGLVEVLDWAGAVLNRVNRPMFFRRFEEEHAVQYFYEPFLGAFDPELRKELGVWYTPREVVRYMVARVDTVLREELGIADGLADPNVYVLDPCCGTGAYLVEVLDRIAETLNAKGDDALVAHDLKRAAVGRVFGFEILPAPYVISHLQLGLSMQRHGAPFDERGNERAGVYLTNALTGWEPPDGVAKDRLRQLSVSYPELAQERDAAADVKKERPILVVLGNPPYNAFAGTSPEEEQGLVDSYKDGLASVWGIRKFNLDDLYVRFFRLAERRIAEMTGRGVVCYITNYSFLSDPSFVVMRRRFLEEFDRLWLDCMNGDSRETGKTTPDGKPDPSVFSTERNREGIRVGTAISLLVRVGGRARPLVRYRDFWGVDKREQLLASVRAGAHGPRFVHARPSKSNRYSFRPSTVTSEYGRWPSLIELSLLRPYNGPIERRGNSLVVFDDQVAQLEYVRDFLDPQKSDADVAAIAPRFMVSSGEYDAASARALLKGRVRYDKRHIVPYPFKPFDQRVAYLDDNIQPLFSRPSPELLATRAIDGNAYLVVRDAAAKKDEGPPFYYTRFVCDYDFLSGHARHIPLLVRVNAKGYRGMGRMFAGTEPAKVVNLSESARAYLLLTGVAKSARDDAAVRTLWLHVLAIGYAPRYLTANADGIRRDWPRVPLPAKRKALLASATLGQQVAALLNTEASVVGVTSGALRPELKAMGTLVRDGGGPLNPDKGDLALTSGWGHRGKGGVTMPAKGCYKQRDYLPDEVVALRTGAKALKLPFEEALSRLGRSTYDVYLNDRAYWRNVPEKVWEYYIGGYQVIKKWLSYRERELLGRDLRPEEARYVTEIVRRIAALVLLQPALDANYEKVKAATYKWPSADK